VNFSVDTIRFIAIFAIIFLHCISFPYRFLNPQTSSMDIFNWFTVDVYDAIGMVGVPLFVMLTGALLLNPNKADEPLRVFYRKRLDRIGLPFVFWTVVYFAWTFLVVGKPITALNIGEGLVNGAYPHLWYLYLLLGLYAVTPFFRVLLKHLNRRHLLYLLAIWFVGTVLVPILHLFPELNYNPVSFVFIDWIGVYLLGFYLLGTKLKRSRAWLAALFGLLVTVLGEWAVEAIAGERYVGFFHGYLTFNMIIASAAIFLILISIPPTHLISHRKTNRVVHWVSQNTLPIYLIHMIFLDIFALGYLGIYLNTYTWLPIIDNPVFALLVFGVSCAAVFALKKIPYVEKLIG
jgi:surface polysaccharide O-acyltransferase-like enzyme